MQIIKDALPPLEERLAELQAETDKLFDQAVFLRLLAPFPSAEELKSGKLYPDSMADMAAELKRRYETATPYQQQNLLTVAQKEQYDAIQAAAAGGLPEAGTATVRFVLSADGVEAPELADKLSLKVSSGIRQTNSYSTLGMGYSEYDWTVIWDHIPDVEVGGISIGRETIVPGEGFVAATLTVKQDYVDQYEVMGYRLDDDELRSGATWDGMWEIHAGENVVTFYVRAKNTIQDKKDAARESLGKVYAGYSKAHYSSAKWAEMTAAYDKGTTAIAAAESEAAIDAALNAATAAMAAVKTLMQEAEGQQRPEVGAYGSAHVVIENTTVPDADITGTIAEMDVPLDENSTMMTAALYALEQNGYTWKGTGGKGGGDWGKDNTVTYLSAIKDKNGKTLGEFSASAKSGWMGTLNDWFTNEGFQSFSVYASNKSYQLRDGDEIKLMFTDAYGEDLDGTWGSTDTSLKSLTVSGGTLTPSFAGGTLGYLLNRGSGTIAVSPEAVNKNFQVRVYLNETSGDNWYRKGESIPAKVGDTIHVGVGDYSWPSMNNQSGNTNTYSATWYTLKMVDSGSADSVAALIDGISSVTYANYKTQAEKAALARAAYDALSADARKNVGNYAKLTEAETQVTKYQQIDHVKALLAAVPAADKLTTADKSKVQAAYDAYEKLDADQRLYITVGDTMKYEAARKWLSEQGIEAGGTITGSEKAPEEAVAGGGTVELRPEAVTDKNGTARAEVSEKTVDEALKQAAEDSGIASITISPEITGKVGKVSVELPGAAVASIASKSKLDLIVSTPIAELTVSSAGLAGLVEMSGKTVAVSAESIKGEDGKATGTFSVAVAVDGKNVGTVTGGLKVRIPAAGAASGTVLMLVDADGRETVIRKSFTEAGAVTALLKGSATVKAVDNSKTFSDVAEGYWGRDAIAFVSSRELFQGTGGDVFGAVDPMTRSMLVTVLHRLEDEAAAAAAHGFGDVPADIWYADAVSWASEKGIVTGTGSGFDPEGHITRESLVVMLYRYAGEPKTADGALDGFGDADAVSDWAVGAMKWAVQSGLLTGKYGKNLDPAGEASRAEVAAILQRMVGLMVR